MEGSSEARAACCKSTGNGYFKIMRWQDGRCTAVHPRGPTGSNNLLDTDIIRLTSGRFNSDDIYQGSERVLRLNREYQHCGPRLPGSHINSI